MAKPKDIQSLNHFVNKPTLNFSDIGANNTAAVKAAEGAVNALSCINTNASIRYLQLFDSTTALVGSEVPVEVFLIPASNQVVIGEDYFSRFGRWFGTGIIFGFSTTQNTFTAGVAGDQTTIIQFK